MKEFKRPKVGELIAIIDGSTTTIGVYLGKIKDGITTVYYAYLNYDHIQPGLEETYNNPRTIRIIEPGDSLEVTTEDMEDKVVNVMEYYSKFLDSDGLVKLNLVEGQLAMDGCTVQTNVPSIGLLSLLSSLS